MATLTVIILAKNEEQHMKDCIASAQFADEVLLAFPAAWTGTFQVPESVKSFAESAFDGTNLECIDARSCTLEQTGSIPETVKLLE